jgi:hypothetical protein
VVIQSACVQLRHREHSVLRRRPSRDQNVATSVHFLHLGFSNFTVTGHGGSFAPRPATEQDAIATKVLRICNFYVVSTPAVRRRTLMNTPARAPSAIDIGTLSIGSAQLPAA